MKKDFMKKGIVLAVSIAVMAGVLTGCGSSKEEVESQAADKKITVAIVQPMSHSSLDQIRDTIENELNASGKNIEIKIGNANGDTSTLTTILSNFKADNVDIVVPIATSTAQTAKAVYEGKDTPIVFAAVSDPKAAGLVGEGCDSITGVSNNIPAGEIVKLVKQFQPDYKKIGFVYTSSETNSVSTIKTAKEYCEENKIPYEEATISNLSELQTAVMTLLSKGVDALYTGNDNTIASAMNTYTDTAYGKGVPVYCGADSMVADGGFATVGVDYVKLGKQVADIILKVADGINVKDIPYETIDEYAKVINLQAADKIGMTLTDKMMDGFEVLVEKDGTSHFGE